MTDNSNTRPATDDPALAARLAAVQQRRAGTTTRRRHPAKRSRIAAATLGIGATAVIAAALDLAGAYGAGPASTTPVAAQDRPLIVVVHHRAGSTGYSTPVVPRPVVRAAPAQSHTAPVARTHGSR